jgi:tetratricopeptide (TPR) repeat protein
VSTARLRYLGYQLALALPSAVCAVAVAQTVPPGRPYLRLLSVGVVVFFWLLMTTRVKRWYFGDRLRQRLRDGHFGEVADLYAPAFAHSHSPAARVRMALLMSVCELERDRAAAALTWLDRVEPAALDEVSRSILLSQRARALADDPARALPIAEEAVARSAGGPNEVGALTSRGIVRLRAGQIEAALADLERATTLATERGGEVPYLAAARARFLGEAYVAAGAPGRAREAYARAAAFPRHIPAVQAAAAALATLDERAPADGTGPPAPEPAR